MTRCQVSDRRRPLPYLSESPQGLPRLHHRQLRIRRRMDLRQGLRNARATLGIRRSRPSPDGARRRRNRPSHSQLSRLVKMSVVSFDLSVVSGQLSVAQFVCLRLGSQSMAFVFDKGPRTALGCQSLNAYAWAGVCRRGHSSSTTDKRQLTSPNRRTSLLFRRSIERAVDNGGVVGDNEEPEKCDCGWLARVYEGQLTTDH